jgi:DNA-binding transcriptional ArsR family regulator
VVDGPRQEANDDGKDSTMTEEWDEIGYVISSQYRVTVLKHLADGPATPSKIASDAELSIAHISRALGELRDHSLVTLLVSEDRKKGRVYGITDEGEGIWEEIEVRNLAD